MDTNFLLGKWRPLRAELDGAHAPDEVLGKMTMEFKLQHYQVDFGGEVTDQGRYHSNSESDAETLVIILQGEKGPNLGQTIPALVQGRGDRLRICYGLNGQAPTDFTTAAGSKRYLVNYRRVAS